MIITKRPLITKVLSEVSPKSRKAYASSCAQVSLKIYIEWGDKTKFPHFNPNYIDSIVRTAWELTEGRQVKDFDLGEVIEKITFLAPDTEEVLDAYVGLEALNTIASAVTCAFSVDGHIENAMSAGISVLRAIDFNNSEYRQPDNYNEWENIQASRLEDEGVPLGSEWNRQLNLLKMLGSMPDSHINRGALQNFIN